MNKKSELQQRAIAQSTQDQIMAEFTAQQNKNEVVEILKELFDRNKINLITDLDHDEIVLCTRILSVSKMKGLTAWDDAISFYTSLMLSKRRKSRGEIIEGIKGYNERTSGIRKFLGIGNRGRY